jgi:adenylate cyclase
MAKAWLFGPPWTRKRVYQLLMQALLPTAIVVFFLAVQYQDPLERMRIRDFAFDWLHKVHPGAYVEDVPVRVVAIDDKSLETLGQWPWPRTVLAQIIDQLTAFGARVVVLDLILAEADRTSPNVVKQFWPENAQLDALLQTFPSHDEMLAAIFSQSRVVTGIQAYNSDIHKPLPPRKTHIAVEGGDIASWVRSWSDGTGYYPALVGSAMGAGVVTMAPDHDGILRSMPLVSALGDEHALYPSLALEGLRVYLGSSDLLAKFLSPQKASWLQPPGIEGIQVGTAAYLPTSPEARVWLHMRPKSNDRYVSAIDILDGKVEPKRIKDHIVVIGATSVGLGDVVRTPLGQLVPGVEGHVQLIEQLLTNEYLLRPGWENAFVTGLMLSYGLAMALMLAYFRPIWSVVLLGAGVVGLASLSMWLFVSQYLLFDPLYPALGLTALFLSLFVPGYLRTEKEQRWIRTAFSRYISPNRVKYLQENPETLVLGGEYRECSFVMTDLAGFTSMMEKYEPSILSSLLNEYLNSMIEIAFAHDGTLDRIVGDAVAVMFSAPVVQPDHAARAVACAIAMDEFAHAFSQSQQTRGIPFGRTRIGVNTGDVMVGNFGGKVMFDYRALGDAINTAARLESINGQLGTRICISGSTVQQMKNFRGRPGGRLVLKGKTVPITVYEPLTEGEDASERMEQYRSAYALMDAESPQAADAFKLMATQYPDDPLVNYHARRFEAGDTGSVVVMSRK